MLMPRLIAAQFNPEILFAAFAILVFIVQMIGRIFNAAVKPAQPARRVGQPPRIPNQADGDKDADPLRGEIEEFLKRVSNRREPQQAKAANQPAANQQRPVQPPATEQRPNQQRGGQQRPNQGRTGQPQQARKYTPPQQGGSRKRQPPVIVASAGNATAVPADKPHDSIEDHVKKFLSNQQFQNTGQISSINRQEKQFERQVEQDFAHEVGHLRASNLGNATQATDVKRSNQMERTAVPVLTAENLRTAMILNEILSRPEHRW